MTPPHAALKQTRMSARHAPLRFFTGAEQACAAAILGLLTGQDDDLRIPVLEMVDAWLAAGEAVGWRRADMPEDGQAWRDTLRHLDADAGTRCGTTFAAAPQKDQEAMLTMPPAAVLGPAAGHPRMSSGRDASCGLPPTSPNQSLPGRAR